MASSYFSGSEHSLTKVKECYRESLSNKWLTKASGKTSTLFFRGKLQLLEFTHKINVFGADYFELVATFSELKYRKIPWAIALAIFVRYWGSANLADSAELVK